MTERILTGITTTGTPHLGNYVGAIRPAIEASNADGAESFFFLADYHALIKCQDPVRVERSRREVAAAWIASGLNTERVTFYRQSDVPEITQLTWLLTCVTAKGHMNRSHAYKAAVDANTAGGADTDAGVTMGLFSYPILMAADILMFNATKVPVGLDQLQHIEMARDLAQRFNYLYGVSSSPFVLPEAVVSKDYELLPGLDGRKMSKSYNNVIPLFEGGRKGLRDAVARIVTDSRMPGDPKDPSATPLMTIYKSFATADESLYYAEELKGGLGWGAAKAKLVELLESKIGPMRPTHSYAMASPREIEDVLTEGAIKARKVAWPLLQEVKSLVGLRD